MFSLFKRDRSKDAPKESTFKSRVAQFWTWYPTVASRFYETIQAGKCAALADETSQAVNQLVPGLAWVFGPGENKQGHSLTLSGEGNLHRQLLTQYWLAQAPKIPGWTFYASRQPSSIRGQRLEMAGRKFDPLEFWITPHIDPEDEKVDITVWHPLFEILPERERWTVLFIFLDEVLGEYGTQQWIGEIKMDPKRLADSIPLEELHDFLNRLTAEKGWKKLPPGESATSYHIKEPGNRFLRDDIFVGTTMHPGLINEHLKAQGELADPLSSTGADYVFIALDAAILPEGNQAHARGEIEDELDKVLRSATSGRLLGGAHGRQNAYIDLLLFDGPTSVEMVLESLRRRKLPPGTSLNYFAKEKRGHRRLL